MMDEQEIIEHNDLAAAIVHLTERKGVGALVTPTEVAQYAKPPTGKESKGREAWRGQLRHVRSAAIGLARKGKIDIVRKGCAVDPSKPFKGLYKLRYREN
jgi:hypothetical protein